MPEIIEAKSIQLDRVVEPGSIELDAPQGEDKELSIVQGKAAPFKLGDIFREDTKKLRARASNAMTYADMFNISPSQAYEHHDEISEQLGGEHLETTELIGGMLTLPIVAGLATNPIGVLLGMGTFEAIGEAESAAISFANGDKYKVFQKQGLKDLLPEDTSRVITDAVDVMDFIGKAMMAKAAFKRSPKVIEKITKQIIEEHSLPKSLYIDPAELKAELQVGGVLGVAEMDVVKGLGLNGAEYRQAIKGGIHIEIPAEKISILQDRPWFAKIKSLFKIDPAQQKFVTKEGKVTYRFGEGDPKEAPGARVEGSLIEETQKPTEAPVKPLTEEGVGKVDPLIEEAKKYKSAEDFVNEADFSNEYVFHRGSDPKNAKNIILAADDRATIEQYGDEEYLIPKNNLIDMPDWVQEYAEKYYMDEYGSDYEDMLPPNASPDDIVDSADVWDDPAFVFKFWEDNESELLTLADKGIFGFKTNDGAVIFQNENIPYKTKSQLTDIWNKAQGAKPKVAEDPLESTEEPITEYEIGELNKVDEQITAEASRQAEINVYRKLEKKKAKDEKEVQKMAQQDIADTPVYRAMAEIKSRGGLNLEKLSKDYSVEDRAELTRKYPGLISKTGKVSLDEVADELGYDSDTALMDEMLSVGSKKEAIQKYIDDFYRKYYDDMMEQGEDVLPMLHAEESRLLKEATKKYKIKPAKGLKKFIREKTGQTKVKDIIEVKPGEILEYAMKEAQKAARVAYRAGDKEGIAKAKAKYREALEKKREKTYVSDRIKKIVKDLKKVDAEKLTPAQSEPVKNLLDGLDFTKPTSKTLLKLSKTREYLADNPEAEIPDYVMERLSRLDKKNVRDITLDELESIHDAVMHRVHLSKLKNKIRVRRKLQEEAEVLQGAIAEMKPREELKTDIIRSQQGELGSRKNTWKLLKDTFGIRHDHYDLIVEKLAGPNSTMDKVLYQDVKEGIIKQLAYRQDVYKKFKSKADKIGIKDVSEWLIEEVETGKFTLTRNERMALYKHSQNPDNRKALIEGGFGFRTSPDPNRVYTITESELSETVESLTTEEVAFADIWDAISEEQYAALNKVFLEKNGYNLPKEEIYYPKDVMPAARGKDFESEDAFEKLKGKWTRIGIEKGMLEKRRRVQLPIYLNSFTYDVNKSVMKSSAYIGLELPLNNASRLLYNDLFKGELRTRYGDQTWIEIEKGLRDIAGDWQSYTTVEEIALKLKNNLTTAILGLNPFVMAKQVLSLPVYLPYIKSEYISQGFMDYMSDPNSVKTRHDMFSPEWVERMDGGYSRDVADIFKGAGEKRLYGGKASVKEKIMGGIKLFDEYAVASGMQGAVLQVLDEFKAGKLSKEVSTALDVSNEDIANLTPDDKMRLAYRYADFATERTQPMFSPEHRSSLSRGSTIEKLATMFGSFTNQALNLVRRTAREGARTGNYESLARALFVVFIVNTAGVMAIDEIRNRIYKRDGGSLPGRILNSWAGYVFFLRDLSSSVISKIERGTFMGYDVSWPITRVPQLMSDVIANGVAMMTEENKAKQKKAAERFVDDSLNLLLMMIGIPYQTPKKLTQAVVEAAND